MAATVISLKNAGRYGDLFVEALRLFGMLCIGIYRVKDPTGTEPTASSRRYVITNPSDDFILMRTDLVSRINLCIIERMVIKITN